MDTQPVVVVCRAAAQAGPLIADLERLGCEVVSMPLAEVVGPADAAPLEAALEELGTYRWVAFTSSNAVAAFAGAVAAFAGAVAALAPVTQPPGLSVATVGAATSAAVRAAGWTVAVEAAPATAADLAARLVADHRPARLLAPLAELAGDDLTAPLTAAGWEVTRVEAYRTVTPAHPDAMLERAAAADLVCLTAGSLAERLVAALGDRHRPPAVCIGPSTAAAARSLGLDVVAIADPHDRAGLVAAVANTLRP